MSIEVMLNKYKTSSRQITDAICALDADGLPVGAARLACVQATACTCVRCMHFP
jgi:hypothetical protein